ncbi:hypothetical protein ABW19_dt0201882 [Dactylella cylindrospora]|nr:hypothetical protein ABW19_dt0201882 [Dactylella cylindrospora]
MQTGTTDPEQNPAMLATEGCHKVSLTTLPVELFRSIVELVVADDITFYGLVEKRLVCKLFDYEICRGIAANFGYRHYRYASDEFMLRLLLLLCREPFGRSLGLIVAVLNGAKNLQERCPDEWSGREEDIIQCLCKLVIAGESPFWIGHKNYLKETPTAACLEEQNGYLGSAAIAASYHGSVASVQALLDAGVDINLNDRYFGSLLAAAVCGGKLDMVRFLTAGPKTVNAKLGRQFNAFSLAIYNHDQEILKELLDWDSAKDPKYRELSVGCLGAAVILAAEAGNLEAIRMLANWETRNSYFSYAKHGAISRACLRGSEAIFQFLIGDYTDQQPRYERSILHYQPYGAIYNDGDAQTTTITQLACKSGNLKLVKRLADMAARLVPHTGNIFTGSQPDALVLAIRHGHVDLVELLVNGDSNDNRQKLYPVDNLSYALNEAAAIGDLSIVKMLIRSGASINGPVGVQAIEQALLAGHNDVTAHLLEAVLRKPCSSDAVEDCKLLGAKGFLEKHGIPVNDLYVHTPGIVAIDQPLAKRIIRLVPAQGSASVAICRCGYQSKHPSSRSYYIQVTNPQKSHQLSFPHIGPNAVTSFLSI